MKPTKITTPRGTFKITKIFEDSEIAKTEGYGYAFTSGNNNIYMKFEGDDLYHPKVALVKKYPNIA